MASGVINGTTSNEYIAVKVEWSSVSNGSVANTSTVTAALYYRRTNTGFTTYGTGTFSITINGTAKNATKTLTIGTSWVKAVESTVTVSHASNGRRDITISASGSIPDTTLTSSSVSGKVTLDAIPRESTLDSLSCATSYFNGEMTYKYTTKSASLYNRCNIALNIDGTYHAVKSINLGNTSPQQVTKKVSLSASELSIIYCKLTHSTKGILRFTLRTYLDSGYSTQVGDAVYKELTLSIPNTTDTQPTATMTLSAVNSLSAPFSSMYIAGKTKVDANFTNGAGKYEAGIVSYSMSVGGKSYGSPYTSDYLTTTGTLTVTGTVKDSRGFSRKYSQSIEVIPYAVPKILPASGESEVVCKRCDKDGNITESGTYLKIKAKRSYSKVLYGEYQYNFCQIRYRYKPEGGSYSSWTTILASNSLSDEVETSALLGGVLSVKSSYLVQLQAVDDIGEIGVTSINVPTEEVYMHKAGSIRSLGFGEYVSEENTFSVAEDIGARFKGGFKPIEIPEYTDLDTLKKPNSYFARYTYVPTYINCPLTVQTTFSLEVIAMGKDGQMMQRLTRCSEEATVYERQYYSAAWHEWECVNPPMVLGVEYRTKERYLGKPVYTKVVDFGSLPNTAYKLVEHGADVSRAIRCVGQMSDGNSLPFHFSDTNWVEIYAGPQYIVIRTGDNKTSRTAYAQMWYVKE